jgi:predicted secreted protein
MASPEGVHMSEIVVTRQDQCRVFEADQNDVILFRLEENLTTGFGWEMETVEGSAVDLIESTYVEAKGAAIGRGGTRVLRFEARSPGIQKIRLQLRRPWDPPEKALEHLEVTIQVHQTTGG